MSDHSANLGRLDAEEAGAEQSERWRDVPGFPGYRASTEGRIMGPSGRILADCMDASGYKRCAIRLGGPKRVVSHHSMVALAFIGPRPVGLELDHIDHNRANNRPQNLRYVTHTENMATVINPRKGTGRPGGRLRKGTPRGRSGQDNSNSVLTEALAREILALPRPVTASAPGKPMANSVREIARRYGISRGAVNNLLAGRTWPHLTARGSQADCQTSGHTPGPWHYWEHYSGAHDEYVIGPGNFETCAAVRRGSDDVAGNMRATARLIASAPDLLEALKLAETLHRDGILGVPDGFWTRVHDARRAAIAKATGEQA